MSADFQDEIEAINSIYTETTLTLHSAPSTYLLTLPSTNSVLRLHIPENYPAEAPPSILGLESAGDLTKRGSGARDLEVFTGVLGRVFYPGEVCLFDAIEETSREIEEACAAEEELEEDDVPGEGEHVATEKEVTEVTLTEPPQWVISSPWSENKSTFVARAARVKSPNVAREYINHLMASDKRIRTAHHNITAWRIQGSEGTVYQNCDDDGETAAGGRLLHLMQIADVWDVVVVVTRWYGGMKIGPKRFALINNAGREALVLGGWIKEKEKEDKKKKKR